MYNERLRKEVSTLLFDIERNCQEVYGSSPFQIRLESIKALLAADEFRIAVVGEFSSGKSTFINALIGYDILPHARSETTATITHVHNVSQGDARCGSVEIEFVDDERDNLILDIASNPDALKNYVTTFSKAHRVVDEIKLVHIYVHFLNVEDPVVLIDTPGLNGTAEGHRSVTLREVEKAHASIFLFHLRALTESDLDFLKDLARHQSSILYVINHIDEIKESEGETVAEVLQDFHQQITTLFADVHFEGKACRTFGISALKALVHKDNTIPKLYSSDLAELTELERAKLWDESLFGIFEHALQDYLVTSREQDFKSTVIKAIESVIAEISNNLQQEIDCIELQISQGDNHRVSTYISELTSRRENSWGKIESYLKNRSAVLKADATAHTQDRLLEISEILKAQINESDLDTLQAAVEGNRYGKEINQEVNTLLRSLQRLLKISFEDIYEIGIIETDRFTSEVVIKYDKKHQVQGLKFHIDENILSKDKVKLAEEKGSLSDLRVDLHSTEIKNQLSLNQRKEFLAEYNRHESRIEMTNTAHSKAERGLGKRPGVSYKTKTRSVSRDGLFGSFLDVFTTKTESYQVEDSSQRKAYDREMDNIKQQYSSQLNTLYLKKSSLEEQLDALKSTARITDAKQQQLKDKIRRQDQRVSEMDNHLQNKLKNHRLQVTREKREELCGKVEHSLCNQVLKALDKSLGESIKNESIKINDKLKQYHQRKFEQYFKKLTALNGSSKTIDLPSLNAALLEFNKLSVAVRNLKESENALQNAI
ncbi:dynamin family protein [Endozoicomonas sp.]|uniref:dynamin family protein n=1 Tax=Endozoicomonas sp. TaxID=1892382 RepID=UPI00383B5751